MRPAPRLTWLLISVALAGCATDAKKVNDANEAARSWAATVKVVTEQWAQSRVSLRFTRTMLDTATTDLNRQADAIRSIDPAAAARIERLKDAIGPVMRAVAMNEPDQARDAAAPLPSIADPRRRGSPTRAADESSPTAEAGR